MPRSITVLALAFVIGCTAPRAEDAPDVETVRGELEALWSSYVAAARAGDADALAALYADSGLLMETGLPTVEGRDRLRTVITEVLGGVRFLEASVTPQRTEMAGDRALQFGTYRDVLKPTGQPAQVMTGRFAAVFVRDSTATWRISRLVAIADSTALQVVPPTPR